jgi:hypothetical protein
MPTQSTAVGGSDDLMVLPTWPRTRDHNNCAIRGSGVPSFGAYRDKPGFATVDFLAGASGKRGTVEPTKLYDLSQLTAIAEHAVSI